MGVRVLVVVMILLGRESIMIARTKAYTSKKKEKKSNGSRNTEQQ